MLFRRPLSPHLGIYRPQITSVLSILHRITGVVLALGALFLVGWIMAVVGGPESYAAIKRGVGSWLGLIFLLGFGFALYYHLFNGIRHLFWDSGRGLSLRAITLTGWAVVILAAVATFLTWCLSVGGGAL